MPVFFGIIALLSILFYLDLTYFKPLIEVYEFFRVAALFFLYMEYVCPNEEIWRTKTKKEMLYPEEA